MTGMKLCVACGMPMKTAADFAMGDTEKDYCVHCARTDGSMQSYGEKAASLAAFLVMTQGLDGGAALEAAKGMMTRLPAWKGVGGIA